MGRPLRLTDPRFVHLITLRTREARLYLRPARDSNELIGGVVARYQELYGIQIHAYIFLGNHYHLVVSDPSGNLWRFEQGINREITRRINWKLQSEGTIWARRYDDQVAPEHNDAVDALIYVTLNAVRHKLVYHPKDWPGLNGYEQLQTGEDREFPFVNYSAYSQARLRDPQVQISDFTTYHKLVLSPLPGSGVESVAEQWQLIKARFEKRLDEIRLEHKLSPSMFRKVDYTKQSPFSRPANISRSLRPLCYTKSFEVKKVFRNYYNPLRDAYREVSRRFRSGDYTVTFPAHTLKPPLHSTPAC